MQRGMSKRLLSDRGSTSLENFGVRLLPIFPPWQPTPVPATINAKQINFIKINTEQIIKTNEIRTTFQNDATSSSFRKKTSIHIYLPQQAFPKNPFPQSEVLINSIDCFASTRPKTNKMVQGALNLMPSYQANKERIILWGVTTQDFKFDKIQFKAQFMSQPIQSNYQNLQKLPLYTQAPTTKPFYNDKLLFHTSHFCATAVTSHNTRVRHGCHTRPFKSQPASQQPPLCNRKRLRLRKQHIDYLISEATLKSQAHLSIIQRAKLLHRTFQRSKYLQPHSAGYTQNKTFVSAHTKGQKRHLWEFNIGATAHHLSHIDTPLFSESPSIKVRKFVFLTERVSP